MNLKEKYTTEVVPALKKNLGLSNPNRVPRPEKVVLNMGLGIVDKDRIKAQMENLSVITGQKPIAIKARNSISNFKLREGVEIGAKVTLRGKRMYQFLERLINVSLPRIRDFRGISANSFDGRGNYTFGVKDVEIFPEIDPNKATTDQGLDITVVTSTTDDGEARELLKLLGMPFEDKS